MKIWEIWMGGYLASGMEGIPAKAQKIGDVEAETFQQACDILCSPKEWQNEWGNYDSDHLTVWGCGLFDNEQDARRSFG
jgi:hypothetical protein